MKIIKKIFKQKKESTFLQSIIVGFKHGWNMSTLPPYILPFHNHPIIRMFRFIGGVCIIYWLWSLNNNDPNGFIILPIVMIHFLYMIIIAIIKTKYIIYLWRSGKLDVRNSPVNRFASLISKLTLCIKTGICDYALPTGGVLGLGMGIDALLEQSGRDKVFTPFLGDLLDKSLTKVGIPNESTKEFADMKRNLRLLNRKLFNSMDEMQMLNAFKEWVLLFEDTKLNEEVNNIVKEDLSVKMDDIKNAQEKIIEQLKKNELKKIATPPSVVVEESLKVEEISSFKRNLEIGNEIERSESPLKKLRGKRNNSTLYNN